MTEDFTDEKNKGKEPACDVELLLSNQKKKLRLIFSLTQPLNQFTKHFF